MAARCYGTEVSDAWQILRDGGLPLATPRSGLSRTSVELASATRSAIRLAPEGREAEALAAFLFAWHHHWPQSFATSFVLDASEIVDWATRHALDGDRYLKLRRIALENLSRIL